LETHIQITERLNDINEIKNIKVLDKTAEMGKMLNGLRKSIKKKSEP